MRRILFLALMLSSVGAWAEDYYWLADISPIRFNSAEEACSFYPNWRNTGRYSKFSIVWVGPPQRHQCRGVRISSGSDELIGAIERFGDSCSEGTEYNPATGSCDQDCSDTIGQNLLVRGPNSPVFNSNGKNYVLASANDVDGTCTSSCRYDSISSFAGSCYLVAGSTDTGYCNYIVTGTGDSCSTHNLTPGDMSGDPLNSPDPGDGGGDGGDPDEPDQPDPCHGVPGYTWNGSTCVNTGGGDGDGDGDGSGDGDGGGGGPGGPGNGGGDGGGDGNGDGNGDGDGDGDGSGTGPGGGGGGGNCDPASSECEGSESEVTGEACDVTINCKGDAVMCAILRQEKAQRCLQEELFEVTPEKTAGMKTELDTHFAGDEYQPLVPDADSTFDFSNMIDTSSRFSNSCPTIPDLSVPWIRGSVTVPFSSAIADLCPYLTWFGYFVVAFAMRRAAEIIALGMN